jgi:hypothetical protein
LKGNTDAVSDWRGVGDLFALATERLTAPVEGMHRAIADRWFGMAGPRGEPVRRGYQTLTAGIYRSVRLAGLLFGAAVGVGAGALNRRSGPRPLAPPPRYRSIQAVANAVWGDELEDRGSDLSIEMGLRDGSGAPIDPGDRALIEAYPEPTPRLVLLLHGLGETERCFQNKGEDGRAAVGLGDALRADAFTPLLIRYNSGRRVSDNGRALALLLDEIVESWPVPVQEVALVGNSMGGLVVRSALYAGRADRHRWVDVTRHVIAVGTPHLGAPLEKGAHALALGLRVTPESRSIGEFLDLRSAGIKDLRRGSLRDADQPGVQEAAPNEGPGDDVAFPEHVRQHFVAGVVTEQSNHPIGVLVGDLIVRTGSGTGRGRHRTVEADHIRVIGKRRHSDLAGDPIVHQQVREWLATASGDH